MNKPVLSIKAIYLLVTIPILAGTLGLFIDPNVRSTVVASNKTQSTFIIETATGHEEVLDLSQTSPAWRQKLSNHIFTNIERELHSLEQQLQNSAKGKWIIKRVRISLKKMKSGKQKFVSTGRELFLSSFYNGRMVLEYNLWKLKGLTRDLEMGPATTERLYRVYALMNKWLVYVAHREINARRQGDLDTPLQTATKPMPDTAVSSTSLQEISKVAMITKEEMEEAGKVFSQSYSSARETVPVIREETLDPLPNFKEETDSHEASDISNWVIILAMGAGVLIVLFLLFRIKFKPLHLKDPFTNGSNNEDTDNELISINDFVMSESIDYGIPKEDDSSHDYVARQIEAWTKDDDQESSIIESEPESIASQSTENRFGDETLDETAFQVGVTQEQEYTPEKHLSTSDEVTSSPKAHEETVLDEKKKSSQVWMNLLKKDRSPTEEQEIPGKEKPDQELENIRAENTTLTENLEALRQEKEDLEKQLKSFTSERDEFDQTQKTLQSEKEDLSRKMENGLKENNSLTKELEILHSEKEKFAQELETIRLKNTSLTEKLETSQDERESLEKQLESFTAEKEKINQGWQNNFTNNNSLTEELEALRQEKEGLEKQLKSFATEREDFNRTRETLQTEKDELSRKMENTLAENESLTKKLNSTSSESETLREQLKLLQAEKKEFEQKQESIRAKNTSLTENLEALRQGKEGLEKQLNSFITEKEEFDQMRETLHTEKEELTRKMENILAESNSLTKELDILHTEKEKFAQELETIRLKNTSLTEKLEVSHDERESLEKQLESLTAEKEKIDQDLENTLAENDSLTKKMNSTSSKSKTLKQQLKNLQAEKEELEAIRKNTLAKNDSLTKELETAQKINKSLEQKQKSAGPKLKVVKKSNKELENKQKIATEEYEALTNELKAANKKIKRLEKTVENSSNEQEALTKRLKTAQKKNKKLTEEQNRAPEEQEALTNELKAALKKIRGLEKTLKSTSNEQEASTKKLKTAQEKIKTITKKNKSLVNQFKSIQAENDQANELDPGFLAELQAMSVEVKDLKRKLESTSSPKDQESNLPEAMALETILDILRGFTDINKNLCQITESRYTPSTKKSRGNSKKKKPKKS